MNENEIDAYLEASANETAADIWMSYKQGTKWILTKGGNIMSYTIESSQMKDNNCPKCNQPIAKSHLTKTDKDNSNEDVYGWHYYHPCGATILIINS